jgi:hypothetical protein
MNSKRRIIKLGLLALLVTIGLAATIALIGCQSVTTEGAAVASEIEGTWLATITVDIPDGPPPFPSLLTYARGGGLTVTDSSVAPALGNVYQGTWAKTGPQEFAFTFLGFQYDANGAFAGYIRGHENIRFQPDGKAYDSTATLEFLDKDQNVTGTGTSTSHATRVNAQ